MDYNSYNYYDPNPSIFDIIFGSLPLMLFCLAIIVFSYVVIWKIFVKAGIPGWWSIIPFANMYKMFELFWGEGKGWMFILMFIPFANVIVGIMLLVKMAHSFGKSGGFAAGLIFLTIIFEAILAFGPDKYIGPDGVPPYRPEAPIQQ